jgi:hypothetical protein
VSDQPPEEPAKDRMEVWYETGEITWQKPLPPESEARIRDLYDELLREQGDGRDADSN